eukprot:m.164381 g.164381  ORF g.164381 m.164381 type:complete len:1094 (+) comp16577_c0_seq3:100-3381(+)
MLSFQRQVVLDVNDTSDPGFLVTRKGTDSTILARHPTGFFVQAIKEGSPAANALLVDGDYLLKVNDQDVTSASHDQIKSLLAGGKVILDVECYAIHYIMRTRVLMKLRNDKLYRREYFLNPDATRLQWMSQQKGWRESYIVTADLVEVRTGRNTTSFKRGFADLNTSNSRQIGNESRCFSLIFGESEEVQDLCADHQVTANAFIVAVRHFIKQFRLAELSSISYEEEKNIRDQWLREMFKRADANNDQQLSLDEISKLLLQLNVSIPRDTLRKKFRDADKDGKGTEGYGKLDQKEFAQFYKALMVRPEIGYLMIEYGTAGRAIRGSAAVDTFDDVTMSPAQLAGFMLNEQSDDMDDDEAAKLIEKYEPYRQDGMMGIDGFSAMLTCLSNSAYNPKHLSDIYQEMDHPLSHYFIASSHNTYLMEDQLYGPSDLEAYIRALRHGCRCVEIDCWDGDNGEPVVFHGHTLTSKILLKDVLRTCAEFGFVASQYPLILSIENHLCLEQQDKLAAYAREFFGERLAVVPISSDPMPSPQSLLGKVIIKGKVLPPDQDTAEMSEDDEAVEALGDAAGNKKAMRKQPKAMQNLLKKQAKAASGHHKVKVSRAFSAIVSLAGVKYRGPETLATSNQLAMQMSSFGEKKALKLMEQEEYSNLFVQRNARQLARTYPDGLRVMSTNYDPQPMFNTGCQIVALNYQTMGDEMSQYMGKFADNGGCGYLLKPGALRQVHSTFNPNRPHTFPVDSFRVVQLEIISGQQLPKPLRNSKKNHRGEVIDPYVIVKLNGVPADQAEAKTKVINNNGFNPVWKQKMQFNVRLPELALLTFQVYDDDRFNGDDFIASATIPVPSLQQGYRQVHLNSINNKRVSGASLFVRISVLDAACQPPATETELAKARAQTDTERAVTGVPELDSDFKSSKHAEIQLRRAKLLRAVHNVKSLLAVEPTVSMKLVMENLARRCDEENVDVAAEPRGNAGGEALALIPHPQDGDAFAAGTLRAVFQAYDGLTAASLSLLMSHKTMLVREQAVLAAYEKYNDQQTWAQVKSKYSFSDKKNARARSNYDARLAALREAVRVEQQTVVLVRNFFNDADEVFGQRV